MGSVTGEIALNAIISADDSTVQVRAERSGTGDGRVYAIAFTATETYGATYLGTVTVGPRCRRSSSPTSKASPRKIPRPRTHRGTPPPGKAPGHSPTSKARNHGMSGNPPPWSEPPHPLASGRPPLNVTTLKITNSRATSVGTPQGSPQYVQAFHRLSQEFPRESNSWPSSLCRIKERLRSG